MSKFSDNILTGFGALWLTAALVGCGSGKGSQGVTPPASNIAGLWEFIAVSNASGNSTSGIEVALSEGQVLDNGIEVPSGQINANSSQMQFVSLKSVNSIFNITAFGGMCGATFTSVNALTGTVGQLGSTITFTLTANNNVFDVVATLGTDGKSVINGTYTPETGNTCADPGGTITGTAVVVPSGQYVGSMCSPAEALPCSSRNDSVTATVSSKSNTITLSLELSGVDNATLTLTGPATGNSFSAQGVFQGQGITYYGYFEPTGSSALESIYLVSANDPCLSTPDTSCTTATVLQTP